MKATKKDLKQWAEESNNPLVSEGYLMAVEAIESLESRIQELEVKPITPARGEPMPKTIEYYQKRGDADQKLILQYEEDIAHYKRTVNNLRQKLERKG